MGSARELRFGETVPVVRRARLPVDYSSVGGVAAALDIVLVLATSIGAGVAYHQFEFGDIGDLGNYLGAGLAVAALFVTSLHARRLYRMSMLLQLGRQLREVAVIWGFVFLLLTAIAFALKIGDVLSRGTVLLFFVTGLFAVTAVRVGFSRFVAKAVSAGVLRGKRVIVVGEPLQLSRQDVIGSLQRDGYIVDQVVAVALNGDAEGGVAVDEAVNDVVAFARHHPVEEIILAADWSHLKPVEDLSARLSLLPLAVKLLPDHNTRELLQRPVCEVGATLAVEMQRPPLTGLERFSKSLLDFSVAGLGVIILSPLLLIVALVIRLDSPGPALFRQKRAGFSGRPFIIYKFRTMTTLEDGAVVTQARRDDARVTAVGRLLRRTSIDELPQLLNVLKGDMSLVGPRPHALAHETEYDALIANYAKRHHMKPGITGWAQVNGCRGETPRVEDMERRVEHDLWYISSWSLWLDVRILVKTVIKQIRILDDAY